jgi:hypothetical protein
MTTTRLRPRALVHCGSAEAAGLLVDTAWIGTDEARRRVLAVWRPGTRVWGGGTWLAVVWPEPVRMRADEAPGALLVRQGAALSSVALSESELEALPPVPDAIVRVRGGDLHNEPLGAELDLSTWFDVVALEHERSAPLNEPTAQAILLTESASEERVDQAFRATVGEQATERADVSRALADVAGGRRVKSATEARSGSPGLFAAAWSAIVGVFATAIAGFGGAHGSVARGGSSSSALTVQHAAPPGSFDAWRTRLARAIRHLAAQALLRLRLAQFVGRAHSEYLAKMVDFFERDDFENALRYAIPLGGSASPDATPALSPPRPRDTLALTTQRRGVSSIGVVDDLYNDLRKRYRAAFEKLDRAGEVDRAAFVLAELLQASAEAVAYLEKHRRFALAAELAEARGLPPELVVRLWFRAGDRRRAIALARRYGCFALAVERLERDDAEAALALRLSWADACASAGDYIAAITVARGVASAERLVVGWIDRALELGGASAATASVLKLEIDPGTFADVHERMAVLLRDESPLAQPARQAFLTALSISSAPGAPALARAAVRAVVANRKAYPRTLIDELVAKTADPSLRMHALGAPTIERRTIPPEPGEVSAIAYVREGRDGSGVRIHDAAVVAHGRLLVALGELGVRLVEQDGRTLARFDAPASALVVSSNGDRALAVIARDDAVEVARIDVIRRRAQRWGLLVVDSFARTFDGATWFVCRAGEVLALDATADDFHAMWRTKMEGDARVTELYWSDRRLVALGRPADPSDSSQVEVFELPAGTLRQRRGFERGVEGLGVVAPEEGGFGYRGIDMQRNYGPILCSELTLLENARVDLAEGSWCVRGSLTDGRSAVHVGWRANDVAGETARCVLAGPVGTRLQEPAAILFDTRGRVLVLNTCDGTVVTELLLGV